MDKETVLSKITELGLIAIVRAESGEQALKITEACINGGAYAVEITFTVPGAEDIIKTLAKEYTNGELILGAGTVMDAETARIAILAGAQYIVSPYLNVEVVKMCNRYRVPCMPGAMTIKEVVEGMEAGADMIKVFPADIVGPEFIKAVSGPVPQAKMIPTGGVALNNVKEWIQAGAVAVGAAGSLVAGAKSGDYALITNTAREFIKRIQEARGM